MPWKIEKRNEEYCVIKKSDGEVEGCHSTSEKAKAQLAALNIAESEKGAFDFITGLFTKIKSTFLPTAPVTPPPSSISFTKQADGTYRWEAIWTNKYRDNDNPPEILAEVAHRDFVKAVEVDQSWPQPELWLWHIDGSRFGSTDLVAYDVESGFNIAVGTVDKGMERVVEIVSAIPASELAVSHGMPKSEIEYDTEDKSVIVRYRTKEISLLPLFAAANKLTSFKLLGGNEMELEPKGSEEKLKSLVGDHGAAEIADLLNLKGQEAVDSELEFKDAEEATEEVTDEATEETEEIVEVAEEAVEEVADEDAPKSSSDALSRQEVHDAMTELASIILTEVKSISEQLQTGFQQEIAELKGQLDAERKAAEEIAWTPAPSLTEMVKQSVIGSHEAQVDGRTKEGRDKPKEAQEGQQPTLVNDPEMNDVFTTILNGDFDSMFAPQGENV